MAEPIRFDEFQIERVRRLYELFQQGKISVPDQHEVHPKLPLGSRENYLYFTLSCCLNFRRSSISLWHSALATFDDPQCNYLFFPEEVKRRDFATIQRDLTKHGLALQVNRHPQIWAAICGTLADHYNGDPRAVLQESRFDVPRIIQTLQRDKKHLFPYLGGRKLSNYWLFIMSRFTDAPLEQVDRISIIPDSNVIKSTARLGLAGMNVTPSEVEAIWRTVTQQLGVPPIELHPVLWNWARNGFQPEL